MRNVKPLAALVLTGLGSAFVATFQVAEPPAIATATGTSATSAGATAGTAATGTTATATTSPPSPSTTSTGGTTTATATPAATAAPSAPAATATVTTAQYADGTYAGAAVREPWGTFQVQAAISGGRLTNVTVVAAPTDGHSSRINSQAIPILTQAAIAAQNAQVDTISGATWTSQSYATSLQAALDAAATAASTTQTAG